MKPGVQEAQRSRDELVVMLDLLEFTRLAVRGAEETSGLEQGSGRALEVSLDILSEKVGEVHGIVERWADSLKEADPPRSSREADRLVPR